MTYGRNRQPQPAPADSPMKHVIEEYRHQAQQVTCVCGWQGSTAELRGSPSPWTSHVREFKPGKPGTAPARA